MVTFKKTLVVACPDDRVQDPLTGLCKRIGEEDGVEPYRNTSFGASLAYALPSSSAVFMHAARAALQVVTRIVIVDHDGGENEPGCKAYQVEYAFPEDLKLDEAEDYLHRENLATAVVRFRQALEALGRDPDSVVIETYIDHHDTGLERVEVQTSALSAT